MTAPITYEIGSTLAGIDALVNIGAIEPKAEYNEYAETITLANGSTRGAGLPFATWLFGYLTSDQYDVLRAFCSGASASVFIATINNDNDFVRYAGIIKFPERYTIRDGRRVDVSITISHLVAQT